MKTRINLLEGNILPALSALALPIMATSLIQMAYNLIDMIWIGKIGASAVASVGAAGMFMWLSNGLVTLAKMGGQIKVGHALGAQKKEDVNLWYRPLDPASERDFYLDARRDAWISIYGADLPFDGPAFWEGAERAMAQDPMALTVAMAGQEPAGLLQLDPQRDREEGVGFLSLYYMTPAFRFRGLGVQLLGQAVSFYRGLGRTSLRLRCARRSRPAVL